MRWLVRVVLLAAAFVTFLPVFKDTWLPLGVPDRHVRGRGCSCRSSPAAASPTHFSAGTMDRVLDAGRSHSRVSGSPVARSAGFV